MNSDFPGIKLAFLEGMSETLLLALKDAGITTQEELQAQSETPDARKALAAQLGVPQLTLDSLHYLNFVPPEERASRLLRHETMLRTELSDAKNSLRRLRVMVWISLGVAMVAILLAAAIPWKTKTDLAYSKERGLALEDSLFFIASQLERLGPVMREQNIVRLAAATEMILPAPGWNGPIEWSSGDHESLVWSLGGSQEDQKLLGVSLALRRLAALEGVQSLTRLPGDKAQEAAALFRDFPALNSPQDAWDLAAAAIRLRFASRALGLVTVEDQNMQVLVSAAGFWQGHPFAPCEALVLSLEQLPMSQKAIPLWIDALGELRHRANLARDERGDHPQVWAREYWILRGELEFGVMTSALGAKDLGEWFGGSPKEFLQDRTRYLERAQEAAPAQAQASLAWLRVEYEEALALAYWLEQHPQELSFLNNAPWFAALAKLEGIRTALQVSEVLSDLIKRALEVEGYRGSQNFLHPRLVWEASFKPLLMETRAQVSKLSEGGPPSEP
jgi:hypothetical protein